VLLSNTYALSVVDIYGVCIAIAVWTFESNSRSTPLLSSRRLTAPMSLQDLHPELIPSTLLLLPLADVCCLRLASKRLAFDQKHFKAKFRTKRLELTEQQLRSFVAVAAHGGLRVYWLLAPRRQELRVQRTQFDDAISSGGVLPTLSLPDDNVITSPEQLE
jgi:hypothetical protein